MKLAEGYDMTMARCILTLYRSAAQPRWHSSVRTSRRRRSARAST